MKTRLTVAQMGDGRVAAPPEFSAARTLVVERLSEFMRLFGIASLTITPHAIGIKAVIDVAMAPLLGDPPPAFKAGRNYMARMLGDLMHLFGITTIEMQPSEADMAVIRSQWESLVTPDESPPVNVKAPPVLDPTNVSVLRRVGEN